MKLNLRPEKIMKEYSESAKRTSAILSIMLSYFLVIINYHCVINLSMHTTGNHMLWNSLEYGGALLSITVPVILSWNIFKLKLRDILWVFPVIFLCVLLYSPPGYYFLIEKDIFLLEGEKPNNWKFALPISAMFFGIQFCAVTIVKGILPVKPQSLI